MSHLIADGVESVGDFNFQTMFRQVILDKAPQSARRLNVNLGLLAKSKYKGGRHAFVDGESKTAKLAVVPMMQKMKRIECRMLGFRRNHSLEFYGNTTRLVITPITAKCQLALVSTMRYCVPTVCLGKSAGESVFSSRYVGLLGNVYISCTISHATTVLELKSLLCGICSLGAWGCLKRFASLRKCWP